MDKIRVGQEWHEKKYNQRVMRVEELVTRSDGSVAAVRMRLISGTGNPQTKIQPYILHSGWTLKKEAPDAPPRRIALTLAADTTATECGACPMLDEYEYGGAGCCHAFDDEAPPRKGGVRQRLARCIAAEVPNG